MSDTQKAEAAFTQALRGKTQPHGELVAVTASQWVEECPTEESWHFTHPEHPNIIVDWHPGYKPRARKIVE